MKSKTSKQVSGAKGAKTQHIKLKQPKANGSRKFASSSLTGSVKTARGERRIPALAARAVIAAARRARSSGVTVVEVSGTHLVSVSPNGTRTVMKDIQPGVRVTVGKQIRLR